MALPEYPTHCTAISCAIELHQSPRRAWRRGEGHSRETRALSFDGEFSASRCRTPNPLISKGFRLQEVPFVPDTFSGPHWSIETPLGRSAISRRTAAAG